MKFLKKDDGFGKKEIQKQIRLSKDNNTTLRELAKLYNRSEADIVNELLYFETKKLAFLNNFKEVFEKKRFCEIRTRDGEFIGYFPEKTNKPDLWNNFTTENRLGYQFLSIMVSESRVPPYKYFVEFKKYINIYESMDKYPQTALYSNYFTGNRNIMEAKELLNILEELNIDIYTIDIIE